MTETNKKLSRREAIKIVGTAAGASLLANIPAKWSRPELTGGNLPAHAQISCPGWTISVEWSDDLNIDLILILPGSLNGFHVATIGFLGPPYGPYEPTTGAQHGGNVTSAGTETITVPNLIDGTWTVYIRNYNDASVPITVSYGGFINYNTAIIMPAVSELHLVVNIENCVGTISAG